MLKLRIVRSPLKREENEAILRDYNRLTSSRIPIAEFVRWVNESPAGPAWHAILETEESRIVGHTSLIPLKTAYGGPSFVPAKSEYSFVHEDFRSTPIEGFENVKRAKFLILVDRLFQHGLAQGWGPYFVSTATANYPLSRRVGCRPVELPLWECLFVLRPVNAARHTANLSPRQRAVLYAAGMSQWAMSSLATLLLSTNGRIRRVPIGSELPSPSSRQIALFEDSPSMQWRYPEEQYTRFALDSTPEKYVIAKRGSDERYLRVCQWELGEADIGTPLILHLLKQAQEDNAMGIRWAIYDGDTVSGKLVSTLRKLGFLCARRVRTMMVHSKSPEFLAPEVWKANDSLFSFDP
jgi:hypothetical protein